MVMPRDAVPAVVLFIALVLSAALTALAASGHFPPEHRALSLRSGVGRAILFGACAVSALALLVGAAAAWAVLPWPAAVIGAGAAMLTAPLLLRPLPDAFVNGRTALLAFASASALLALALLSLQ
ncbi:MAG TPA: hypothetical protein VFO15_03865 [Xanthobacteraceae bacterium]|nr:hypothetical protein [Xanthobacteraceae bacterium]